MCEITSVSTRIDPVHVREALNRLLGSEGFRSSPRLSRFLQYLVEASLRGSDESLKEYSIGIDVFDKPKTFDPRLDSTVRGEATKLRLKLRLYYETEGRDDPVVIQIPKGGYRADFSSRLRRKKTRWHVLVGAGFGCFILAAIWWTARTSAPSEPSLSRLTSDVGLTIYPAVSPGGDLIAFASDRSGRGDLDIWIQSRAGGAPRRVTEHPADDYDLNFSPDGGTIAFRSERDGGGAYTVGTMGGEPRFVAAGGHHPRYSPDGAWIAYSIGSPRMLAGAPGSGQMFVVPARGGTPRQIQPDFLSAHHPIWSRDGKHLLFLGRPPGSISGRLDLDWWITPVAGGRAIKTGALPELVRLKLDPPVWPRVPLTPSHWGTDYLLFSNRLKDTTNLWKLPFDSQRFRVTGRAQRLTFGAGSEVSPAVAPSGEVLFADLRDNYEIWSLPIDADRGEVKGPLRQETRNIAIDRWPSISRDGRKLMYLSFRSGSPEVWLKELDTGRETQLTSDGAPKDWPEIAPDGGSYYFTRTERPAAVWWARIQQTPKQLCSDCQTLSPLSGGGFLHTNLSLPIHPHIMDSSGGSSSWLRHPRWDLHQPQLSPDGGWIAFYASYAPERSQIFIARFQRNAPPLQGEWIAVTRGEFLATTPFWSPDGNRLYFASNQDNFQCIWSVPLSPASKAPSGPSAEVAHFHHATRQLGNVGLTRRGMSVARDRIVFPLVERTGNLWILRPR